MRLYSSFLILSLAAVVVLIGTSYAHAQSAGAVSTTPASAVVAAPTTSAPTTGSVKIALIDDQKLLSQSKAAKNIEEQIDKKRDGYQKEFSSLEAQLRDKDKKLESSKDKMSAEDYDKQRAAFQNEVMKDQKLAQDRRQELEHAAADAVTKLRTQITKIVANLADKNSYDLVLTRQNIVLAKDSMDITDSVLSQLDSTMTTVPMTFASSDNSQTTKTK